MKTDLKSFVEEIIKSESWKYNRSQDISFSKGKESQFVKSFLDFSEKDNFANNFSDLEQDKDGKKRLKHIVYAFFLGIAVYDKSIVIRYLIDKEIDKYRYALNPFHKDAPFAYVWFLICVFHDCGYTYERKLTKETFQSFDEMVSYFGELGKIDGVPILYEKVMKPYFRYRMDDNGRNVDNGVNDHGIVGAYKMYHDFCQIRAEKRQTEERNLPNSDKWVKGLDDVYNLAAWIVGCHNIFFANSSDKCGICRFSSYHLYSLMKEDCDYKIELAEYPLFFFIHLIDNVEPTKIPGFKDDYLEKISIEVCDDKKEITISFPNPNEKANQDMKDFLSNYKRRLIDLNSWLTTTILNEKPNAVSIVIHYNPQNK